MKLNYLLISRVLLVAVLVGTVGYGSLSRLNLVVEPLNVQMPESIQQVRDASSMDSLAPLILYYDEVLTQSARNFGFTNDSKWFERYQTAKKEINLKIEEAIQNGDDKDRNILSSMSSAQIALESMESESIQLTSEAKREEAIGILDSEEYLYKKGIYLQGISDFVSASKVKNDKAINDLSTNLNFVTSSTKDVVNSSSRILWALIVLTLLIVIFLGFYFTNAISKPLNKLTKTVDEVSKGNFDVEVEKSGIVDEINTLADSLNRVMKTMKLAVLESASRKKKR